MSFLYSFIFSMTLLSNFFYALELKTPIFEDEIIKEIIGNFLNSQPDQIDALSKLEDASFLNEFEKGENNEDKYLKLPDLVKKYGYTLKKYPVQTEDGYNITVYRIPSKDYSKGDPVLVVHGLLNSAVDWFTVGRNEALPYLLADGGFDVWLFNARGTNEDSKGHVSMSPEEDKQYWQFSWDEIGRFDLTATIDVVLKTTGRKTLRYVGHSQGTTVFFVMTSERPEYNDKISIMVALSPVVWMSHIPSLLLRILALFGNNFSFLLLEGINFYAVDANNPLIQFITKIICGNAGSATIICNNVISLVSGFDYSQVNATQLPVIFAHTPSSCSTKQLIHYAQEIKSGKFRNYDYGSVENMKKYKTIEPPNYNISKVSAPVALFYSKTGDYCSAYEDVSILYSKLSNVVKVYKVPHKTWSHLDFLWAKDVKYFIYTNVLNLFETYGVNPTTENVTVP